MKLANSIIAGLFFHLPETPIEPKDYTKSSKNLSSSWNAYFGFRLPWSAKKSWGVRRRTPYRWYDLAGICCDRCCYSSRSNFDRSVWWKHFQDGSSICQRLATHHRRHFCRAMDWGTVATGFVQVPSPIDTPTAISTYDSWAAPAFPLVTPGLTEVPQHWSSETSHCPH